MTAHRRQTLSLLDIRNILEVNDRIEIKIPESIKTSGLGRKQPVLILLKFVTDPKICVFSMVKNYLLKTAHLREQEAALFVSFRKPHTAVDGQLLSRWIKIVLKNIGINTELFTAHSTRHTATSSANRVSISLDVIRKTAGWNQNSTVFAI